MIVFFHVKPEPVGLMDFKRQPFDEADGLPAVAFPFFRNDDPAELDAVFRSRSPASMIYPTRVSAWTIRCEMSGSVSACRCLSSGHRITNALFSGLCSAVRT